MNFQIRRGLAIRPTPIQGLTVQGPVLASYTELEGVPGTTRAKILRRPPACATPAHARPRVTIRSMNPSPAEIRPEVPGNSESIESDGFIRFRRSTFYAILAPLAFVTGLAVGYLAWGRSSAEPVVQAAPVAAATAPATNTRIEVETDDDPVLGPDSAPITIVEFSDFNCPFCRSFHQETFAELLEAYPGQIRFVYRDYPITTQESFVAAQASECADDQGRYWEFHDALFSGRRELGMDAYRAYAEDIGLDADELIECVEEGRFAEEVQLDARYAAALGVTGTPTFFINGVPLVGAQPLNRFTQVIENELR